MTQLWINGKDYGIVTEADAETHHLEAIVNSGEKFIFIQSVKIQPEPGLEFIGIWNV